MDVLYWCIIIPRPTLSTSVNGVNLIESRNKFISQSLLCVMYCSRLTIDAKGYLKLAIAPSDIAYITKEECTKRGGGWGLSEVVTQTHFSLMGPEFASHV